MPVVIRSAVINDVPEIVVLERQAQTAAHWPAEEYRKLIGDGIVLVAEDADQLCGFICVKVVAGEWEIENIVVATAFLRRGIANTLLLALIQRAQIETASAILLEVRESNFPARGLYEKHGILEVGRRRGYYQDPVEDAVLYALRFES